MTASASLTGRPTGGKRRTQAVTRRGAGTIPPRQHRAGV